RQLWPVASLAEYRLALRAPGRWSAEVLREGTGHFALGPLTEVAASTHEWSALAPWLEPGPAAAYVAHERVLPGEGLRDAVVAAAALDLPLVLWVWEPAYALAVYEDEEATFDPPPVPAVEPVTLPLSVAAVEPDDGLRALAELAEHWPRQSNGRVQVVAVDGD